MPRKPGAGVAMALTVNDAPVFRWRPHRGKFGLEIPAFAIKVIISFVLWDRLQKSAILFGVKAKLQKFLQCRYFEQYHIKMHETECFPEDDFEKTDCEPRRCCLKDTGTVQTGMVHQNGQMDKNYRRQNFG